MRRGFVFGYRDSGKTELVYGYYDSKNRLFVIEPYSDSCVGFSLDFIAGYMELPYFHMDGVGSETFKGMFKKDYVRDHCFFLDYLGFLESSDSSKIVVKNGETFEITVGLNGRKRWNTGRVFERCNVRLSYDDYFGSFGIEIVPSRNVSVVVYGDMSDGTEVDRYEGNKA